MLAQESDKYTVGGHRGAKTLKDESNRIIKTDTTTPAKGLLGGIFGKTENIETAVMYGTDEHGNNVELASGYFVDGKIQYSNNFKHDEQGRPIQIIKTNSDGSQEISEKSYNDNGSLDTVTTTSTDKNGKTSSKSIRYDYDENGNLLGSFNDKDNDGLTDSYTRHGINEYGSPVYEEYIDKNHDGKAEKLIITEDRPQNILTNTRTAKANPSFSGSVAYADDGNLPTTDEMLKNSLRDDFFEHGRGNVVPFK